MWLKLWEKIDDNLGRIFVLMFFSIFIGDIFNIELLLNFGLGIFIIGMLIFYAYLVRGLFRAILRTLFKADQYDRNKNYLEQQKRK